MTDEELRRLRHEDILKKFKEAQVTAVDRLTERTPESTKLSIYAYYKQATSGRAGSEQPSWTNRWETKKYNEWHRLGAMSEDDAMLNYIKLVNSLPDLRY
jgi:acyl-CoA-binding protein